MKTISIIGTGAIGGYCAVKLSQMGFDLHCLFGRDYQTVHKNGLILIEDGNETVAHVKAYSDIKQMPPSDLVIIALKTTANSILKNTLKFFLKEDSQVLMLQNGIGMEEELAEFIPPEKIIGGICYLKVTKVEPGKVKHFGFNTFELAQYYVDESHEEISPAAKNLTEIFIKAGIEAHARPHLPSIRWKKLCGNIATSGLSIVLNATQNDLALNTSSLFLLRAITREAISAAKKCGAKLPEDFYEFREKVFESFKTMERHNASMKDDFDAKRPIELHCIYENALKTAEKYRAEMPLTNMLYQQLLYLEKNRR